MKKTYKNTPISILLICVLCTLIPTGCNTDKASTAIIPLPVDQVIKDGYFTISDKTKIYYSDTALNFAASHAANLWEHYLGFAVQTSLNKEPSIEQGIVLKLTDSDSLGEEGYRINIGEHNIEISAKEPAGIFYGAQTIFQLLETSKKEKLQCIEIYDYPRFGYRGMHLDVSRHFMPESFIYKTLDNMALHKLNRFHWHLVDDQGWRIEIKQYPKLTDIGAWRVDMTERHWNDRPLTTDRTHANYGGFYTQEQIKRIVAYAAQRNITIMPEIEMPAHAMAVLAAYPELSCTGENLGVPPGGVWPITHIFCAGQEETFTFIENILTEVIDLFPSKHIHIGGDEANKTNWEKCPRCQKRIKKEGLKDENELQSYFIRRIEKFLNQHNRILVGWDEILEGGLAPNAVVMSWRGEKGGIEAAKHGNQAIMSPGSHCYFDHYQGDAEVEPLAFGGFTPLKKVYEYEPIPAKLNTEQAKLILGAQANHWTEYMPNEQQVEYMAFPRLAALSEVLWSPKDTKNWTDFSQRMIAQYKRYEKLKINYSKSAFQIKITPEFDSLKNALKLTLENDTHKPEIRYTLNGTEPTQYSDLYKEPIYITRSVTIKAAVFNDKNLRSGHIRTAQYNLHKAFGANVTLTYPTHKRYNGKSNHTLVDGVIGSIDHGDGKWKGFLKNDMIATIDLGKPVSFQSISVNTLQNVTSWIFFPSEAIFEVSTNNKDFEVIGATESPYPLTQGGKILYNFTCSNKTTNKQYIRVTLKNPGLCPEGHAGEGNPAFIFAGEIMIE